MLVVLYGFVCAKQGRWTVEAQYCLLEDTRIYRNRIYLTRHRYRHCLCLLLPRISRDEDDVGSSQTEHLPKCNVPLSQSTSTAQAASLPRHDHMRLLEHISSQLWLQISCLIVLNNINVHWRNRENNEKLRYCTARTLAAWVDKLML